MNFLRKAWRWLQIKPSAHFSMWVSGVNLANCLHVLATGNYWLAALSGAIFVWASLDAWRHLRRLQVAE